MAVGDIGAALQDSLSLLNGCSRTRGDVAHATGNFMAAVFSEDGSNDITLVTFEVDDCGNIAAAIQDSDVISSAANTVQPAIIKAADGVVAVAFDDGCSGPLVVTYVIDACGNFGTAPTDTLDLSAGTAGIIMTLHPTQQSSLFVAQHFDGCGDIQASTFNINSSGVISGLLDQQEINASNSTSSGMDMVWTGVGDFYAFAYTDLSVDGFIETWDINSVGVFAACPADTHEFETTNAERIAIHSNDNGTLFLLYEGPSSGGDVKTVTVDACGVMTNGTKLDVFSITNDTTDLFRLSTTAGGVYVGVCNSNIRSWTVDGCDVPTQIDTLGSILPVADQGRIAIREGLSDFIVMVGWNVSGTDFLASTLAVEFATAAVPNITQAALPYLALVSFPNLAPAPSFAWFPGLEEEVEGNLLVKLKAGGVL